MRVELPLNLPAGLEHLATSVALIDSRCHSIPCRCFLERDTLSGAILRLRCKYPTARLADLAVLWARMYAFRIIAATLPSALLLDRQVPVAIEETRMVLDPDDGCALCLQVAHAGWRFESRDPFERFRHSIRGHLNPVLEAVSRHMKAPLTALYGDAAVNFHSIAREVTAAASLAGRTLECDVMALSSEETWPDGARNTLNAPFLPTEKCDGRMVRRTCCLNYRLGDVFDFCDTCPISDTRRRPGLKETNRRCGAPVTPSRTMQG